MHAPSFGKLPFVTVQAAVAVLVHVLALAVQKNPLAAEHVSKPQLHLLFPFSLVMPFECTHFGIKQILKPGPVSVASEIHSKVSPLFTETPSGPSVCQ